MLSHVNRAELVLSESPDLMGIDPARHQEDMKGWREDMSSGCSLCELMTYVITKPMVPGCFVVNSIFSAIA